MKKYLLYLAAATMIFCSCEKKDSVDKTKAADQTTNTIPEKVYVIGISYIDISTQGKSYYAVIIQDDYNAQNITFGTTPKLYNKDLPYLKFLSEPILLSEKATSFDLSVCHMDTQDEYDNLQNVLVTSFTYVDILKHNRPDYFESTNPNNGMKVRVWFSYK